MKGSIFGSKHPCRKCNGKKEGKCKNCEQFEKYIMDYMGDPLKRSGNIRIDMAEVFEAKKQQGAFEEVVEDSPDKTSPAEIPSEGYVETEQSSEKAIPLDKAFSDVGMGLSSEIVKEPDHSYEKDIPLGEDDSNFGKGVSSAVTEEAERLTLNEDQFREIITKEKIFLPFEEKLLSAFMSFMRCMPIETIALLMGAIYSSLQRTFDKRITKLLKKLRDKLALQVTDASIEEITPTSFKDMVHVYYYTEEDLSWMKK